ncbi:hypothetical protein [Burkholderia sp. Cy-647]|nr:hypothetical protein [Burkholderia sp. Cy-647]
MHKQPFATRKIASDILFSIAFFSLIVESVSRIPPVQIHEEMSMARFVVRVELHSATWQDYENLHVRMNAIGLGRKIQGANGVWHDLPPAEYYGEGDVSRDDVLAGVKAVAEKVKTSFSVLVTESVTSAWYNLPLSK